MKLFSRISFAVVLCLVLGAAGFVTVSRSAENNIESAILQRLVATLSESAVEFRYDYSAEGDGGKVVLTGSGSVLLQNDAFVMDSDDFEVWCDGRVKWTVDRNAREAVAESFDASSPDYVGNPALLVGNLAKAFSLVSEKSVQYEGKAAKALTLIPAVKMDNVSSAVLYLTEADGSAVPLGLRLDTEDGTKITLTISGFTTAPKSDGKIFSFDETKLGSDWIITDLR